MENNKKLKINNKVFKSIMIPIMSFFLVLAIVVTSASNYFTASLDTFLGKGTRRVTNPKGSNTWDSNFYTKTTDSQKAARDASAIVAEQIADEGIILLKNDGKLPLTKSTPVSPFGYDYLNPVYSGSGSGGTKATDDYAYSLERGLAEAFDNINSKTVEAMKKGTVTKVDTVEANSGNTTNNVFQGSKSAISVYSADVYKGTESSTSNTVGIVFIGRGGGEGGDLYAKAYADGTPHQQAMTKDEKNTIEFAKQNCKLGVVVVLNTCNTMQIADIADDQGVNAIIQLGTPGAVGSKSLGKVLNGKVNPSGRTVDTFAADLTKGPTYANFDNSDGKNNYSNTKYTTHMFLSRMKGTEFKAPFHEYEEGVYLGYRWYETSADLGYFTSSKLPVGVSDKYYNRNNGVVYPFGYGLSYAKFSQKIESYDDSGSKIVIKVKVTNTGKTYSGKDVAQVYYSAPYTALDSDNKIEKSTVNLIAYGKTGEIKPGQSETVSLSFNKEDMASYSFTHDNSNGTKGCYMLEGGDYKISLRNNSHEVIESKTTHINNTIWYDGSDDNHIRQSEKDAQSALDKNGKVLGYPATAEADKNAKFFAASNQFENANKYMTDSSVGNDVTILSRNAWATTQPSAPTDKTRTASDTVKKWLDYSYGDFDYNTDSVLGNVKGSKVYVEDSKKPASNQKNGLTLSDMRGLGYYDPLWEKLLDQIDYTSDEINTALFMNAFASGPLTSVGMNPTLNHDGPQGLTLNSTEGKNFLNCASFPGATTLAQTWNVELAKKMGQAVGEENLWIDGAAWYAPAINLHWSPFSGRNYEYYSEDPLISGMTAAYVISGAGEKGTYCSLKHFAMVDQEAQRWYIPSVWTTEQSVREIYLKAFEIAVKEATKTIKYISDEKGTVSTKTMRAADNIMMSGWSSIGPLWTAYDYNLVTNVLRNEWGFQGFVITDYDNGKGPNDNAAVNHLVRAGTDQHMLDKTLQPGKYTDITSATGMTSLRKAVKNTMYTMANSSQTNGAAPGAVVSYGISPWRLGVIIGDVVIGLGIIFAVIAIIRRKKDEENHPENYRSKKKVKPAK